jgi:hypothetical protein
MTSPERIDELLERVEWDAHFAAALDGDPFATLRSEGFEDVAAEAEQERDRIGELVELIYRDDEFRERVEQDPTGALSLWGLPGIAIEPVLLMAGAPESVVERATADVEAHLSGKKPATVAVAALLGTLAFAQQASAGSNPARAQTQVSTTAQAPQAANPARAQVQLANPAQALQVAKPAQAVQVSNPALARAAWAGLQPQRVAAYGSFASLLRANRAVL